MQLTRFRTHPKLIKGLRSHGGRNATGRITIRHRGGGHARSLRTLDWRRVSEGIVTNRAYDPLRTAPLLTLHTDSVPTRRMAPQGVKPFAKLRTIRHRQRTESLSIGDASILANFEAGDSIHSLERRPGGGGMIARSAGTSIQVLPSISSNYARVRFPSGEQRLLDRRLLATSGVVALPFAPKKLLPGKAGRSRWQGWRPSVRGVARNPVDHPHGGGQGKTKGGRPSVTPWSRITKGQPTISRRRRLTLNASKKAFKLWQHFGNQDIVTQLGTGMVR